MSEGAGKPKVKLTLRPAVAAGAGAAAGAELTLAQKSQQRYGVLALKQYLPKYGFTEDSDFGRKMLAQTYKMAAMTPPEVKAFKDKLKAASQAATAAGVAQDNEDYRKLMVAYMSDLPIPDDEAVELMAAVPAVAPKPRVILKKPATVASAAAAATQVSPS